MQIPKDIERLDTVTDIYQLISHRHEFLWTGFTYKVEFSLDGFDNIIAHIDGYSHETGETRFERYCRSAILMGNPKHDKYYQSPTPFGTKIRMQGLMRIILEKAAKSTGETILEYFSLPNGNLDFKKAREVLRKYFRIRPTGVYWGDKRLRKAEIDQIDDSRLSFASYLVGGGYASIPLNYDEGGKGAPSLLTLVPKIGLYLGLGRSLPQVYDLFIKAGIIRRNMHYNTFKELVKEFFGSMKNAYEQFTEGTISLLGEAGYENSFIYNEYKHFYSKVKPTVISATLDVPKFLTYTKLGYNLKSIAPLLKLSALQLRLLATDYIEENFKEVNSNGEEIWLMPITSRNGKRYGRPFFTDLQSFLIAPIALSYYSNGITIKEVASKFKHGPQDLDGYSRKYIRKLFRDIFHIDAWIIDYRNSLQEIKDIILKFDPVSLTDLGRQFSLSYPSLVARLRDFVVDERQGIKIIEQFKISIIGPLLYNLYKVGLTPIQIAKHNAFFWEDCKVLSKDDANYNSKLDLATQRVISYTILIFQCAPHQVTSNFLSADGYIERFGVIPFNI